LEKVPIVDFTESEFPYLLMGFQLLNWVRD